MIERDELSSSELEDLKRRLIERKAELNQLSSSSAEVRKAVDLDQSRVGRLSRMDALQMQAMERAVEQNRTLERQRIEHAIRLMETGDYGECIRCGELIGRSRIYLDPSLIICVDCAN